MTTTTICFTTIQDALWEIERYLMQRYGVDAARRDMYPLSWYVNTGRASVAYLRKLLSCKPYMIARKLHKGGSYDEVLDRVKAYMDSQQ